MMIPEGSSTPEDNASLPDSTQGYGPSVASIETVDDDDDDPVVEPEQQPMAEKPSSQDRKPSAVRKLNSQLGGF